MSGDLHALIIEDNPADAELLVQELRRAGFIPNVLRVETEEMYLEQLDRGWDLILCDYHLPGFSAPRALALLHESGLELPFIIISGTIGEETAVEAMRQGATDYLLKDRLGRLGPAVDHALRQSRLQRDHHQSREALAASEERFRQLAENIHEVFWITDLRKQRILYVSPAYQGIWGRTCESLYANARGWLDAVHPEDRDEVARAIGLQAEGDYDEEYRIVHADGSIRWVRDRAYPVRDHEGRIYRIVGVAEDITGRREMEERFLRTQRMEAIGTLTSGIAHDLNNILGSMLMSAGLVKSRQRDKRDRDMLAMIEQGAQRGAHMIGQLLSFSRGNDGVRSVLSPDTLIHEMVHLMKETFPSQLEIRLAVGTPMPGIKADETQVHQVLMNLCVNARDAMAAGGTLTLGAKTLELDSRELRLHPQTKPGSFVVFTVSDTGPGIPPSILQRIFDPFFTTKATGKGTGLGLSSVLGIVKNHGGFVTVDSVPGRGALFSVYFPACTESAPAAEPITITPVLSGQGELILIVDDQAAIRDLVKHVLELHGYRVVVAGSAEDALRLFMEHQGIVRLVLTDMMMPGMDGLALIQALRVVSPEVGLVMLGDPRQSGHQRMLDRLDIAQFLRKPFSTEALLKTVEDALSESPRPPMAQSS